MHPVYTAYRLDGPPQNNAPTPAPTGSYGAPPTHLASFYPGKEQVAYVPQPQFQDRREYHGRSASVDEAYYSLHPEDLQHRYSMPDTSLSYQHPPQHLNHQPYLGRSLAPADPGVPLYHCRVYSAQEWDNSVPFHPPSPLPLPPPQQQRQQQQQLPLPQQHFYQPDPAEALPRPGGDASLSPGPSGYSTGESAATEADGGVDDRRGPSQEAPRKAASSTRAPGSRRTRSGEEGGNERAGESEVGDDQDDAGGSELDADGKKTRKRRRTKGELPRDFALRKYLCAECDQKFARPR